MRQKFGSGNCAGFFCHRLGAKFVGVRDDDMCAFLGEQQDCLSAYSTSTTNHKEDLATEFHLGRHALKLGFFERPVLNPKRFGTRECNIIMELLKAL